MNECNTDSTPRQAHERLFQFMYYVHKTNESYFLVCQELILVVTNTGLNCHVWFPNLT